MENSVTRIARAVVLTATVAMAACATAPENITWSMETMPAPSCLIPGDSVVVSWPVAAGGPAADSMNVKIREALGSLVGFGEEWMPGIPFPARIDTLLCQRNRDLIAVRSEMPYQVQIGGVVKHFGSIASVRIDSYLFQGGAHGLGLGTFLNFDSRKGRLIPLSEMVSDTARLSELNKIAFSEHFGDDLASVPLFVTVEALPLPQNVGIDSAGLRMHYNPYEIGPYYLGSTDYLLPMDEVKPLLNPALVN